MTNDYDILIIGGGMVGASLAAALSGCGLRIAVIEARPFGSVDQPSYDERSIALAYGSRRILEGMGLWSAFRAGVTPINEIHVSDRGRFGAARLNAREEGVPALGYVVENRLVGQVLNDYLAGCADVEIIAPAQVEDVQRDAAGVQADISRAGERVRIGARLLVAADGTRSAMRERLGLEVITEDYGQHALIANVTPERDPSGVAYERFTDSGPLALLPMSQGRCSLVWTQRAEDLAGIEALDETAFLQGLQQRFGYRLGRFLKAGARQSYPLALVKAKSLISQRAVLIGNAAHTLHPVAGQGFNLALRDVAELAELIASAVAEGADPGSEVVLSHYNNGRHSDTDTVIRYTDTLVRVFSNAWPPLSHARALGLIAVDLLGPLRHLLARQSMGLRHQQPRLARGLPLRVAS